MHPFHAHCREALASIEAQGRYRRFTPLRKQAGRFPLYRRPDGSEVLVWSSNDYLGMGGHPVGDRGRLRGGARDGRRRGRHAQHQRHQPGA